MDNLTKKCEWKELNNQAEYLIRNLEEKRLIAVQRKIIMCDVCNGYEIKCKGYHPKEPRNENT